MESPTASWVYGGGVGPGWIVPFPGPILWDQVSGDVMDYGIWGVYSAFRGKRSASPLLENDHTAKNSKPLSANLLLNGFDMRDFLEIDLFTCDRPVV